VHVEQTKLSRSIIAAHTSIIIMIAAQLACILVPRTNYVGVTTPNEVSLKFDASSLIQQSIPANYAINRSITSGPVARRIFAFS
jgi:hypothetical protein